MSRFTLYLFYFLHHPLRPLGRETTQSISFWCFFPKFPICLRVFCSNWKQYFSSANRGKNITLQRFVMFFSKFPTPRRLRSKLRGSGSGLELRCDQSFEFQVRASSCDSILQLRLSASTCGLDYQSFEVQARTSSCDSSLQLRLAASTCGLDLRFRLAVSTCSLQSLVAALAVSTCSL